MKFKAVISDEGLRLLQKGFAPTLERFGKTAQVLLGPEDVHLIQDTNNTDGPFVHATLQREALFEGGQVHIGSKYKNLIAFQLDIPNLIRVLHGARNVSASSLEVKLALRELCVDLSTGATAKKPFLTFTSRDANLDMRYDLPISAPYQSTEVEELVQYTDQTTVCPYYLNLQGPELLRVHGALDKLKVSAVGVAGGVARGSLTGPLSSELLGQDRARHDAGRGPARLRQRPERPGRHRAAAAQGSA